jgi:arsenite methyltransferase
LTTRSVLIYVADKAGAFREFHRVLRPGGRISLFEPINRYGLDAWRFDMMPVRPRVEAGHGVVREAVAYLAALKPTPEATAASD